jgi:hypothetical protein
VANPWSLHVSYVSKIILDFHGHCPGSSVCQDFEIFCLLPCQVCFHDANALLTMPKSSCSGSSIFETIEIPFSLLHFVAQFYCIHAIMGVLRVFHTTVKFLKLATETP